MIKPYIKNETAVDIICSICDRMYPGMDCEPSDCEWMKMLAEEAVDGQMQRLHTWPFSQQQRWNVLLHKPGWAFVGNTKFFLLLWRKKGGCG